MDNNVMNLFEHNIRTYKKIKEAYASGENIVVIKHATGTGKTPLSLQLIYDFNKILDSNEPILYYVPNLGIKEHIIDMIKTNPNVDLKKDFPNLDIRTYSSLINMSKEELAELDVSLLIIDEFHHLGAPVWGSKINDIVESHKDLKIFGMSAYSVRDRGTPFERDMTNPDTNELFSNKVVSEYGLTDAIIEKVLPKPIYRSGYVNLYNEVEILEKQIKKMSKSDPRYQELNELLVSCKRKLHDSDNIYNILKSNINVGDKVIYFCPPMKNENINDIDTIMDQIKQKFLKYIDEDDIVFYKTTSSMADHGKSSRYNFYHDLDESGEDASKKLRVMFAINQYNEGIHAPGVNRVVMGRKTNSDIVFFEELGRGLAVRDIDEEEYDKLNNMTIDELKDLCNERDLLIKPDYDKSDLIEILLSPVIIDLSGNIEFIKELEDNLKGKVKEYKRRENPKKSLKLAIKNASFDIKMEDQNLYDALKKIAKRTQMDFDDWYKLAENYYNEYGNLDIKANFRTFNGIDFDSEGHALGNWVKTMRNLYNSLTKDKKAMLDMIGFDLGKEYEWNKMFTLAKKYFNYYGHSCIPNEFLTNNGIKYDRSGYNLGGFIESERKKKRQGKKKELLDSIEFCHGKTFIGDYEDILWYEFYGSIRKNLESKGYIYPIDNAYNCLPERYENMAKLPLISWFLKQYRTFDILPKKEQQKLLDIGFNPTNEELTWYLNYLTFIYLIKGYRLTNVNDIEDNFYTEMDFYGVNKSYHYGRWLNQQKRNFYQLDEQKQKALLDLGLEGIYKNQFDIYFDLAKEYKNYYSNLNVDVGFKTFDGITYHKEGYCLGSWLKRMRNNYDKLPTDIKEKLNDLGIDSQSKNNYPLTWDYYYDTCKKWYSMCNDLNLLYERAADTGMAITPHPEMFMSEWLERQRENYDNLSTEKKDKLKAITFDKEYESNIKYVIKLFKRFKRYHATSVIPINFKTIDGIHYDENGFDLGKYVSEIRKNHYKDENNEELLKAGIFESRFDLAFNELYSLAMSYYAEHNDLKLRQNDPQYGKIYSWLKTITSDYYKYSDEKKKALNDIGFYKITKSKENKIAKLKNMAIMNNISLKDIDILKLIENKELSELIESLSSDDLAIKSDHTKLKLKNLFKNNVI